VTCSGLLLCALAAAQEPPSSASIEVGRDLAVRLDGAPVTTQALSRALLPLCDAPRPRLSVCADGDLPWGRLEMTITSACPRQSLEDQLWSVADRPSGTVAWRLALDGRAHAEDLVPRWVPCIRLLASTDGPAAALRWHPEALAGGDPGPRPGPDVQGSLEEVVVALERAAAKEAVLDPDLELPYRRVHGAAVLIGARTKARLAVGAPLANLPDH
jgi:hypothetical protein